YQTTVNSSSRDLQGNPFPASSFNTAGFANISSNLQTIFDAYKRNTFNGDASYFVTLPGRHPHLQGRVRMDAAGERGASQLQHGSGKSLLEYQLHTGHQFRCLRYD